MKLENDNYYKNGLVVEQVNPDTIRLSLHWLRVAGFRGKVIVSEGMFSDHMMSDHTWTLTDNKITKEGVNVEMAKSKKTTRVISGPYGSTRVQDIKTGRFVKSTK
jgi:hypothetical protein